jgi:hypothetical protein
MGTGLTTILWYALCGGFVGLTIFIGVGLFLWGAHRDKHRRRDQPPS